jgi:hypothetical protein
MWPSIIDADPLFDRHLLSLERVNAVMHAQSFSNIMHASSALRRDALVGCTVPLSSQTPISQFASKTPGSSFDQMSVNCNSREPQSRIDGVMLLFPTRNFIRAGGNDGQHPIRPAGTHVSALLSVLRFNRLAARMGHQPLAWIGAAGAPNNVISGTFRSRIKPSIGSHHRVSHTTKFPGYAVHTGGSGPMRATPEVFLSGKFIMPGIKGPAHAIATLRELIAVVVPFLD